MERYLSFGLSKEAAQESDFSAYSLGTTSLLPYYFGDVAPINVFLGENNSGKSRFMRNVMKCNPTTLLDLTSSADTLASIINASIKKISSLPVQAIAEIGITVQSSGLKDKDLMSFLRLDPEFLAGTTVLKNSPQKAIEDIAIAFQNIKDALISRESLLDFILGGQLDKKIKEIQDNYSSLRRAQNIYTALPESNFKGLNQLNLGSEVVQFSSSTAAISFTTNSYAQSVKFRHPDQRNQISSEALLQINMVLAITESVNGLLAPLNKYTQEERHRTYIPILRTARTLVKTDGSTTQDDMLESTIRKDYELKKGDVLVNTGLSLYTAIDEKRNSDIADREEFEKFEEFLSETFFNGKVVRIVPNRKKTNILVAVDREERALPYLGDGIQAIILLLYPLFIAPKKSWFFIEEPEASLHPGFQRLFIRTTATHKGLTEKKLTIFLTTHSNHLLDFALDEADNINLFTFRKLLAKDGQAKYQIQLTAPQDLECLTALGVQNSSVFLSNCTIWVEGITDRIYIKAYLEVYLKHLNQTFSLLEDLHYSFLEYAGANVSHYAFGTKEQKVTITDDAIKEIQALSISNRIMLIADQDAGKEAKHERLSSQKHAGFEYVVLPTREIENLLSPTVIVGALQKLYPKQNFDVALLKSEKYQESYLGTYLRTKFPTLKESFVANSGTIDSSKKRKFAEAAAEVITIWDMLSPEAQTLTKQVFDFIIGHNPRLGSN